MNNVPERTSPYDIADEQRQTASKMSSQPEGLQRLSAHQKLAQTLANCDITYIVKMKATNDVSGVQELKDDAD